MSQRNKSGVHVLLALFFLPLATCVVKDEQYDCRYQENNKLLLPHGSDGTVPIVFSSWDLPITTMSSGTKLGDAKDHDSNNIVLMIWQTIRIDNADDREKPSAFFAFELTPEQFRTAKFGPIALLPNKSTYSILGGLSGEKPHSNVHYSSAITTYKQTSPTTLRRIGNMLEARIYFSPDFKEPLSNGQFSSVSVNCKLKFAIHDQTFDSREQYDEFQISEKARSEQKR